MINGKSILAIIPARGGSKGLPDKNILPLADKPLIAWTISAAKRSNHIDRCIISTDDEEIAEIGKKYGGEIPFMRPMELATDGAIGNNVIIHALETINKKYDIVIVLQPTSPLRNESDIDAGLDYMLKNEAPACVSVCKSNKPPYWHFTIEQGGKLKSIFPQNKLLTNRQELPVTYMPNGALYIAKTEWFKKTKSFFTESTIAYIMPAERSIDIDSQLDLNYAELLLNNQ